jgi:spore coat protein U-like protein
MVGLALESNMRRILLGLAGFAVVSIAAESRLSGQSATASLTVNASVQKNCTITTAPVNFGAYDPVTANSTSPLDGIGTVTVTCTKGAPAKVGLGTGTNPQGATRRMAAPAAQYLTYELYKEAGRVTIWGDTPTTGLDIPPAPDRNARNFTVFGRVAQAQDAAVGTYTDTVVATVNF